MRHAISYEGQIGHVIAEKWSTTKCTVLTLVRQRCPVGGRDRDKLQTGQTFHYDHGAMLATRLPLAVHLLYWSIFSPVMSKNSNIDWFVCLFVFVLFSTLLSVLFFFCLVESNLGSVCQQLFITHHGCNWNIWLLWVELATGPINKHTQDRLPVVGDVELWCGQMHWSVGF